MHRIWLLGLGIICWTGYVYTVKGLSIKSIVAGVTVGLLIMGIGLIIKETD